MVKLISSTAPTETFWVPEEEADTILKYHQQLHDLVMENNFFQDSFHAGAVRIGRPRIERV